MSDEENKAVVARLVEEVLNEHNPAAAEEFFAADFVEHVPAPGQEQGLEGIKRWLADVYFPAFPDAHWTVEEQIAEGDRVLTRFTWRGTHQGEFAGIPPTGKRVTVWGMVLDLIAEGKLVESRMIMDTMGMMQQLGAIPAPDRTEEAGPPRDRQKLMERLVNARTPTEVAIARAAADSWLATHPSDGDVRMARDQLPDLYPAGD